MKPTHEQQAALSAFSTGRSLKIVAGAGTGKTTTLKLLSGTLPDSSGTYLAFNTAMADDARRRMPSNVSVSTAHSLAFRGTKGAYARKIGSRMTARQAAEVAGLPVEMTLGEKNNKVTLSRINIGYYLLDWIRSFCNSDRPQIDTESMSYTLPLIWLGVDAGEATPTDFRAARKMVEGLAPYAGTLWAAMADPANDTPTTHDVYLKKWVMGGPRLAADFILFDEAQDANPLMLQLVTAQDAQRVYVGDPNQQIYAWRGATNAMQTVKTDATTTLSESFRFGPEIAEFANLVLSRYCQSPLRLVGRADVSAPLERQVRATLCRTNAGVISTLASTPNLSDVHVAGGTDQAVALLRGMQELRERDKTNQIELAHFQGWQEFVDHVAESKDEMSTLLRLSKKGENIPDLIALLSRTQSNPAKAGRVVSTGHKCKGLEWGTVSLDADFVAPGRDGDINAALRGERANLLYVAGTRAQRTLLLSPEFTDAIGCQEAYSAAPPGPPKNTVLAEPLRRIRAQRRPVHPVQVDLFAA